MGDHPRSEDDNRGYSVKSVFVADDHEVHDVPMAVIRRPIQSVLDEDKVQTFMRNIKNGEELTPIEVMWVQTQEGNYYFATGGCHRWEAHKRLNSETIPAKLISVPPTALSTFMGASSPFFKAPGQGEPRTGQGPT